MIDDKKIEEAKNNIFNKHFLKNNEGMICIDHISEPVYLDYQIKQAIELGAKWAINEFIKNLWHPASEESIEFAEVLAEAKITESINTYLSFKRNDALFKNWEAYSLGANITRWLYIDDLFQKEGGNHD